MEPKTHQILVNFDALKPFCILVASSVVGKEYLPQIAETALNRYNSIHSTTYKLSDVTLFLTDPDDTEELPIENYDESKEYELVIRLPNFQNLPNKLNVSLEDEEMNVKQAKIELSKKNYYAASTFASYSPGHIDELANEISTSIYSNLLSTEAKDFQFMKSEQLTFEELIQKCQENSDNNMLVRKYCKELAKIDPFAAIRAMIPFPNTWKFIPEFCQTDETFNFFFEQITNIFISQYGFKCFSQIFFNCGFIERSIQIYNPIGIPIHGSEKEVRAYCWKLFLLFDIQKLHQTLLIFFRIHRNLVIGSLRCETMYNFLCDIYAGRSKNDPPPPPQKIDYSEKNHQELPHIFYLAGLLLFYTGMYDHFVEVFQCSPTNDPASLLKIKPSAREWKLGRSILLNQGWGCEKLPKNRMHCVLCDYRPYKENFVIYDLKKPHDVYLLSHCSFYELASPTSFLEKRCFWNLIEIGKQYKSITIMNGNYDVKTVLPRLVQYLVFPTVTEAIEAIAKSVVIVFQQIHSYLPHMPLYFVEMDQYDREGHVVMRLNEEIRKILPDFVKFRYLPNEDDQPNDSSAIYGKHFTP